MPKHFGAFLLAVLWGGSSALAADNGFDGTYSGTKKVTFGTAPVCGTDEAAAVDVKASILKTSIGPCPLTINIGADGKFQGRVGINAKAGAFKSLRVNGRIAAAVLTADLYQRSLHEHLCTYHWSLRKQ